MNDEVTPSTVVRAYAAAKTGGDIPGALAWCHEDVIFESSAFQSTSHGLNEARQQFGDFLRAFPDYDVHLVDLREIDDLVLGIGRIAATMQGPLLGLKPTRRRFNLPFVCLWYVHDGLIALERFFFDFTQMCEHLGLDLADAAARLRAWRERSAGAATR